MELLLILLAALGAVLWILGRALSPSIQRRHDPPEPQGDRIPAGEARRLEVRATDLDSGGLVTRPGDPGYLTSQERARQAEKDRKVRQREDRLAAGGDVAERERRAAVRGKHYTEWPDTVRELKREGRTDEALELLHECIEAAERDRGDREPAPWYTMHAAIIYRQRKDYAAEVAVIERWIFVAGDPSRWVGETQPKLVARLDKARAFAARAAAAG